MASGSALLTCPMCPFAVGPRDSYILELHFEQEHTPDSPFRIQDDPEPPSPSTVYEPAETSKNGDETSKNGDETSKNGDATSDEDDDNTVLCPEPDCGETVLLTELNEHLDLHTTEKLTFDDEADNDHRKMQSLTEESTPSFLEQNFTSELPDALRHHHHHHHHQPKKIRRKRGNSSTSEKSTLGRSILSFNPFAFALKTPSKAYRLPPDSCRLGRAELGPHAWEDRMPKWLHRQLEEGPKISVVNRIGRDGRLIKQESVQNETPGVIPILVQLSALDKAVKEAYYCHPSTLHIGKTPKEGGFCGYRNIQMLISYIQGAKAQGHEDFTGRTPSILKLQDMIEMAWDKGINEIGRLQTGGIRDTRKYIGTPEAQALLLGRQIDCAIDAFSDSPDGQIEAHERLFVAVEKYFKQAAVEDGSNIFKTLLPPIYLQQPGHSLTIIGFERRRDGSCNLVAFDPMFHTSPSMHRLIGRKNIKTPRPEVMHAYRRTSRQLRRHAGFEILMLTAHPPLFPAWDVLRQFPDCRFLYVFFRSRTLGYDVYPEDHFLRNFPWQQYGGLWIVDDARFARSETMNPLTAAALRRLTGEGSVTQSRHDSGYSSSNLSPNLGAIRSQTGSRRVSWMSPLDCTSAVAPSLDQHEIGPVLSLTGMNPLAQSLPTPHRRKWQGYPSPVSPTPSARNLYPTPPSDKHYGSPRSHMSSDDSVVCGFSHRRFSHNNQGFDIDRPPSHVYHPSLSTSIHIPISPLSSDDPLSPISPKTAMLRAMYQKQVFESLTHNPTTHGPRWGPAASTHTADKCGNSNSSQSPAGTMMSYYTSERGMVDSLLAVKPLSEAQVAEYRFWQACGRRSCPFGCGESQEGEASARERLFRDVEEVKDDTMEN